MWLHVLGQNIMVAVVCGEEGASPHGGLVAQSEKGTGEQVGPLKACLSSLLSTF